MIEKRVVFILGAGASKPFGFYVGSELISAIMGLGSGNGFYTFLTNSGSVRETEMLVAKRSHGTTDKITAGKDQNIIDIENELRQRFGTRVIISHGKKRGRIQIEYYSNEDLNRILDMLSSKNP